MVAPTIESSKAAPKQPATKSDVAVPKLNSDMEMGDLPATDQEQVSGNDDIMQLARVGDISGMEKLFESGNYDATYTDDEGITPLHVCLNPPFYGIILFRCRKNSLVECWRN
jgi:palmitoyltransferase